MPPKEKKKPMRLALVSNPHKAKAKARESKKDTSESESEADVKTETQESQDVQEAQDDKDISADPEEEIPALEFVSDTTKERYEYRPVLRTEIVYRKPEDRVTSEVMTKFELCEIVSIRAKQLEQGKTVFTDVGNLTDPLAIAKKEIIDKKCPLSIVRMLTDRVAEKWQVNEMAIPYDAL